MTPLRRSISSEVCFGTSIEPWPSPSCVMAADLSFCLFRLVLSDQRIRWLEQQIEVINDLRGRLGLGGSDDAPARPVTKSDERKFVRLLPQERLLWTVVRSRYGRYDNAVAEGLEAAHGQRGRFLLSLGATNVLLGAVIFLDDPPVCIATGASSLWPGYVFGMVFVSIGVVRIVQAVCSQPDGSAGPSDAAPPVR